MSNLLRAFLSYIRLSIVFILVFAANTDAAEQETETATPTPVAQPPQPASAKFSSNLEKLAAKKPSDEQFWIEIDSTKVLLLKYWADGRINRGNIVLLPDPSENPAHPRLIYPLAKQLSLLGWTVYAPALPLADFSVVKEEQAEQNPAATQAASTEPNNTQQPPASSENAAQQDTNEAAQSPPAKLPITQPFFSDKAAYQNYINQIIQNTLQKIAPKTEKLVLIGNWRSAFWLLDNKIQAQDVSHIVFIHPKLAHADKAMLENQFKAQNLPVMGLFNIDQSENEFLMCFRKQLWQAPRIRIHQDIFSSQQLYLEINRYAKLITGWVSPLNYD
ncbi:DUF3530 family protein [Aliikangiella sp. IMCC44653]